MTYDEFLKFLDEFKKIQSFRGKINYADQNLTKLGSGTGRIVYDIDGIKIFKLAKNTKGVAQNEEEIRASAYNDYDDIITEVFDSADDGSWIVAEKAKKITQSRFKQLVGADINDVYKYLRNFEVQNRGGRSIFSINPDVNDALNNNDFVQRLANFIMDYDQISGDMGRPSTYGEVVRDGQPRIVLTDYGLTNDVYNTHYAYNRPQRYNIREIYNFADGNDDMLSDIGNVGDDQRHGMWALIPYSVNDDSGVINEDFISFVLNRDKYPTRELPSIPYIVDEFHNCINNIKESLDHVQDKKKFYNNLLSLQNYLISQNYYNRDRLEKEEYIINENSIPNVEQYSLTDENYAKELANEFTEKLNLGHPQLLGGGSNGYAFSLNNNTVLKITSDVSEVDAATKILRANPKTLAKIYNIYKIFDSDKNLSFFAILQENIVLKPLDKFRKFNNDIDKILPNGMELGDIFDRMMKSKKYNYDELVDVANHILSDNPEANVSQVDREAARNYVIGLLNIKEELNKLNIKSTDFITIDNLGYNDGILKYFDIGGYVAQEPNLGDSNVIRLPENEINDVSKLNRDIANNIANKVASVNKYNSPKYSGHGENGFAYDIGNEIIMKITTDKSEAVESLKIKGKLLKHLANIYDVIKITPKSNSNIPETFVIIVEKLKTNESYFNRIIDRLDYAFKKILNLDFYHIIDDYVYNEYEDKKLKIDKYMLRNPEDANFYYGLLAIADEARQYGIESMDYIKASNLGYKKDGNLGFFDMGFGDESIDPDTKFKKIELDEDGSAKFSTDSDIGNDGFPPYEQNDTSELIDNNVPTSELSERILSSMTGSSTVDVKKKCKLAGNGNTSTACNQGDVKNLNIKPLKEDIDASEATNPNSSIQTLIDGKRNIAFTHLTSNQINDLKKMGFDMIPINQTYPNGYKDTIYIIYDDAIKAKELQRIANLKNGFLDDATPDEARKIGKLLGYKDASISEYIRRKYNQTSMNEGVGDRYLDSRFNIEPKFKDFELQYNRISNSENGEDIITDGKISMIRNPKSLNNIEPDARGVIDAQGNLYLEPTVNSLHKELIDFLVSKGLLTYFKDWTKKIPTNFVTVQRIGDSNNIIVGDSTGAMIPYEDRDNTKYWSLFDSREKTQPVIQKFFDKAKQKNPNYNFINELLYIYTNDFTINLNENNIMLLQDLPFKNDVEQHGGTIHSVGGAVRDEFLGKDSKDLDILITGVPLDELESILSKYGKVDAVGKSFGILKFKPTGSTEDIDIAIPRTERANAEGGHKGFDVSSDHTLPIEDDLRRRDFTINAIAKDSNGNIIDPYNGREDLKNKIIRVVNPEAFSDDPLRMLRAVQFASRFGFTIEPTTMKMIQSNASRISEIPPERILTEFDKIIKKGDKSLGAQLLMNTGLYSYIFGVNTKPKKISALFQYVKTLGEFIYLLCVGVVKNPADFFKHKLKGDEFSYREIKALELANSVNDDNLNIIAARSIAHNMFLLSPKSLQSDILPLKIKEASQELLDGKYPKTVNELAVNGNDLMKIGLKGREIGEMQKSLLLKIYADKISNNKEDLLNLAGQSKTNINENTDSNSKIEYGCLMLYLDIPIWKKITSVIKKEDIYNEKGYGIEYEPHLTILYGFHDDVTGDDAFKLFKEHMPLESIEVRINGISVFENKDFDVVKFDVNSKLLVKLNEIMKQLPNTSTFPEYHPHITIAYVKPGEGKKYIKPFEKERILSGDELVFTYKNHKEGKDGDILKLNDNKSLNENVSKYSEVKKSIINSKSISKEMKAEILKYIVGGSTYHEGGHVHGLSKPNEFREKTTKSNGVGLGADKNGFYVYTHRARSKSHASPDKIPVKDIEFIESTG